MKNSGSLGMAIMHLAFFALFPGFFFYHSAAATGSIGLILAGYFSPVALIFMPLLILIYLRTINRNKFLLTTTDFAFFSFLVYFFFIVALNFADGANPELTKNHFLAILQLSAVFIIFRMAEFNSIRFRRIAFACMACMTAIIFTLSMNGFFNLKQQGEFGYAEDVATYQDFARSYLVTFLVIVPFTKAASLRLCLYFICLPALYLNASRSEFVALASLIALTEIISAKHRWMILLLVLGSAAFFISNSNDLIKSLPANRTLELLDLSHSSSWDARRLLSLRALETIAASPLLGDYGSYAGRNCCVGAYAHNILSAWVDLGLLGFVYLLCMLAFPMYFLSVEIASRKAKANPEELVLAFSLLFVTLLLLFTAKDFTYMLTSAALGRYAYYRNTRAAASRMSIRTSRPTGSRAIVPSTIHID